MPLTLPLAPEAAQYLEARRGLSSWDPYLLRWHPECPWENERVGCIMAPVHNPAGDVVAIWRIRPAMEGPVQRRGLAPTKGGCSRLFDAEGPQLVIAEGVEDALAARELTTYPAWAALSAGNMRDLVLPTRFTEVLILADNDEPKKGQRIGLESAHDLARRLRAEGRHVVVRKPIAAKDANDVLRAGRAA